MCNEREGIYENVKAAPKFRLCDCKWGRAKKKLA